MGYKLEEDPLRQGVDVENDAVLRIAISPRSAGGFKANPTVMSASITTPDENLFFFAKSYNLQ